MDGLEFAPPANPIRGVQHLKYMLAERQLRRTTTLAEREQAYGLVRASVRELFAAHADKARPVPNTNRLHSLRLNANLRVDFNELSGAIYIHRQSPRLPLGMYEDAQLRELLVIRPDAAYRRTSVVVYKRPYVSSAYLGSDVEWETEQNIAYAPLTPIDATQAFAEINGLEPLAVATASIE